MDLEADYGWILSFWPLDDRDLKIKSAAKSKEGFWKVFFFFRLGKEKVSGGVLKRAQPDGQPGPLLLVKDFC